MSDWIEFTHEYQPKGEPQCSISKNRIAFNKKFIDEANIADCARVTVLINEKEHKIAFRFHTNKTSNSLALYRSRSERAFSSVAIISKYKWIQDVVSLPRTQRRFRPIKQDINGDVWIIQIPNMK